MEDEYLRRQQAGEYLASRYGICSAKALGRLASLGGGPAFFKAGRRTIYKKSDLDAWALERLGAPVTSTSDYKTRRDQAA